MQRLLVLPALISRCFRRRSLSKRGERTFPPLPEAVALTDQNTPYSIGTQARVVTSLAVSISSSTGLVSSGLEEDCAYTFPRSNRSSLSLSYLDHGVTGTRLNSMPSLPFSLFPSSSSPLSTYLEENLGSGRFSPSHLSGSPVLPSSSICTTAVSTL